jgi:YggT family protein
MNPIIQLLKLVLNIFQIILLIRVLMSYFPQLDRSHPIARFIEQITEPILAPVRQFIPPQQGIDFSPLVVFVIIFLLQSFLR